MTTKRFASAYLKSTDLLEVLNLELSSAESAIDGVLNDILPRTFHALEDSDRVVGKSGFRVTKSEVKALQKALALMGDIADRAEEARAQLEDDADSKIGYLSASELARAAGRPSYSVK